MVATIENRTLKEKAEHLGKQLFIESSVYKVKPENIEVFDKPVKITESSGSSHTARAVLREVEVMLLNEENANGRIYPSTIAEGILKNQYAEGSPSLMGHPANDDSGDPKNLCGVWHNFKVKEGINKPTADWYLIGENGQLILEAVQAGMPVGTSSSGFGTLMEDNKTVTDFELERLGDCVLTPSAGVYATKENLRTEEPTIEEKEEVTVEISEEKNQPIKEEVTNKTIDNDSGIITEETIKDKGKIVEVKSMSTTEKIEVANFKNNVSRCIREAQAAVKNGKVEKLEEAQIELNDFLKNVPEGMEEQKVKLEAKALQVSDKILAVNEETVKELATVSESAETYKTENVQLKERLEKATSVLDEIGGENSKQIVEDLKHDQELLVEDLDSASTDVEQLKINESRMLKDIKGLARVIEDSVKTLSDEGERVPNKISEQIKCLENYIIIAAQNSAKMQSDITSILEQRNAAVEELNEIKEAYGILEMEDEEKDKEKEKKDGEKDKDKEKKDGEKDGDKEKEMKDKEKKEKKESYHRRFSGNRGQRVLPAIKKYFESELEKNRSLRDIEEEVLASKNIMEAVQKVTIFTKPVEEETVKLDESEKKDYTYKGEVDSSWLGNRK